MAPLTWRNVDAPDLTRAGQLLNMAVSGFRDAGSGISDALTDIRDRQRRDRSAAAVPLLAGVANEAGVDPALSQINQMVRPQDMTPELQEALLGIRNTALGYDTTRNNNRINTNQDNRAQTTHERGIRKEDQLGALGRAVAGAEEAAYYDGIEGIGDSYYNSVIQSESSGDPNARSGTSTATGHAGFLEGTWNALMRQYPELGLTPDGRTDPAQSRRALERFTRDNANILQSRGIPLTNGNLYAAHFLGAGGASTVLRAADDTAIADLVSNEVIQANPFLADMSVGEFRQWAHRKGTSGATDSLRIAGSLAEDNLIGPDVISEAIGGIHDARDTRNRDDDDNRDRDYEFDRGVIEDGRTDLKWAREEEQRVLEEEARARADRILQDYASLDEMVTQVNQEDISPEEKQATIAVLRSMSEAAPELFDTEIAGASEQSRNMLEEIMVDQAYTNRGAGGFAGLDLLSEGEDSKALGEQVLEFLSLAKEAEIDIGSSENDIVTAVNRVADEYGIPQSTVFNIAKEQALTGRLAGSGRMFLNEDRLREALEVYGSREDYQAAQAAQIRDRRIVERMESAMAKEAELLNRIHVLETERAPGPGRDKAIAAAEEQLAQVRLQIAQVYNLHRGLVDGETPPPAEEVIPNPRRPQARPASLMRPQSIGPGGFSGGGNVAAAREERAARAAAEAEARAANRVLQRAAWKPRWGISSPRD